MECFLAAKRAGIVDEVAASLKNNYPTLDWNKVIEYNIERMASHGVRRADEMDQVAETLRELGIDPLMASATSTRQREMGQIGKEPAVRKTLKEGPRRDARCHQFGGQRPALILRYAVQSAQKYRPTVRDDDVLRGSYMRV